MSHSHPDRAAAAADTSVPFEDTLAENVRFSVLGRLEIVAGGRDVAPTAPRTLQLLALLLLRAGHVVATDQIIEELWGERPPRQARSSLQTHVCHLRHCIAGLGISGAPEAVLVTKHPGYQLLVDGRRIDLTSFRSWYREGRARLDEGRVAEAAGLLRAANDLWSGPPLANVGCGAVLAAETVELLERHRAARSLRLDAEIDEGRHRELVGELRSLTVAHPLDEVVHAQLIRVLGRCGRRSDAMAVFRRLRDLLADELGVEPGDEVQDAYQELLTFGDLRVAA